MYAINDVKQCDPDIYVDNLLRKYDDTVMSIPDIEFEPHLLISKVRKHYMDCLIDLLCVNYESNHRLVNKNMKYPSAIWRCAKDIEMKAAQTCMMVQLYRKNIVPVIKELKKDTKKGKLFKMLNECLNHPPNNIKKTQTNPVKEDCNCTCNQVKKRRISNEKTNGCTEFNKIPVIVNGHNEFDKNTAQTKVFQRTTEEIKTKTQTISHAASASPKPNVEVTPELQNSDEIMMQLEKLFCEDANDDDLYERALCDTVPIIHNENTKQYNNETNNNPTDIMSTINETQAAQIKSLQDRLAMLEEATANNIKPKQKPIENPKKQTVNNCGKWLCEEYFQKVKLFEILDKIGDTDRKKLSRIKQKFVELFGYDSDDEGVISPLDETHEFIISCKERIAPWVVKLLTPHYMKGKIKGRPLFKALVKYLVKLIYQCSQYPQEYEVESFVLDFLDNHRMINCEDDFKQFRIENI